MKASRRFLTAVSAVLMRCAFIFAGCDNAEEEEVRWDAKPSVMIDGILYGTTGHTAVYRTDEAPDNGGHVDGEITSTVEGYEYPVEDGQSNFGVGYFYRYGEADTVEVFLDDRNWVIFEAYEDQ